LQSCLLWCEVWPSHQSHLHVTKKSVVQSQQLLPMTTAEKMCGRWSRIAQDKKGIWATCIFVKWTFPQGLSVWEGIFGWNWQNMEDSYSGYGIRDTNGDKAIWQRILIRDMVFGIQTGIKRSDWLSRPGTTVV
jgi:hypothetical protein